MMTFRLRLTTTGCTLSSTSGSRGSVVWRSRFLDYTGIFMMHCHMMNHEEMGMTQTVEVCND
jgi:FtsP/CotA-like multicopper oxidase with cupredoxin domain